MMFRPLASQVVAPTSIDRKRTHPIHCLGKIGLIAHIASRDFEPTVVSTEVPDFRIIARTP